MTGAGHSSAGCGSGSWPGRVLGRAVSVLGTARIERFTGMSWSRRRPVKSQQGEVFSTQLCGPGVSCQGAGFEAGALLSGDALRLRRVTCRGWQTARRARCGLGMDRWCIGPCRVDGCGVGG